MTKRRFWPERNWPLGLRRGRSFNGACGWRRSIFDSIQGVYESQNIGINDRHFEVIIRRMSDKVQLLMPVIRNLLSAVLDLLRFRKVNEKAKRERLNWPGQALFRLTKVALIPILGFRRLFRNGQCLNAGVS